MKDYDTEADILKTLGEPTRLRILDVLSCGEMCACRLQERLSISQPTLSHHMKALTACGLVKAHKRATWIYYAIDPERVGGICGFLCEVTRAKAGCEYEASCNDSCKPEQAL